MYVIVSVRPILCMSSCQSDRVYVCHLVSQTDSMYVILSVRPILCMSSCQSDQFYVCHRVSQTDSMYVIVSVRPILCMSSCQSDRFYVCHRVSETDSMYVILSVSLATPGSPPLALQNQRPLTDLVLTSIWVSIATFLITSLVRNGRGAGLVADDSTLRQVVLGYKLPEASG